MPTPGPPSTGGHNAQVSYYSGQLQKLAGTYSGTNSVYNGMSWLQLYQHLATQYPAYTPEQIYAVVIEARALQLAGQSTADTLGQFTSTQNTAVAQTNFALARRADLGSPVSVGFWRRGLKLSRAGTDITAGRG
jgi:hypothetical protein